MKDILKKFGGNYSGAVFAIVAIAIPVIFLILALSIDMGKTQSSYSDNEAAVESAAASVADFVSTARTEKEEPTPEEMHSYALQILNSNVQDQSVGTILPDSLKVELADNKVTVSSCMMVKGGSLSKVTSNSDSNMVCSESSANVLCVTHEVESEGPCPMGQTGTIKYVATTQCPSGVLGAPLPVSNTCKSDCTPSTTSEVKPCPEGTVGAGITMTTSISCPEGEKTTVQTSYACEKPCEQETETQVDQCSQVLSNPKAVGTITKTRTTICPSGEWGDWIQTKYECCIPEVEERTNDCPAGQTGKILQERTKSCPNKTWSEWETVKNTCEKEPEGYKVYQYEYIKDGIVDTGQGVPSSNCPWTAGRKIEYSPNKIDHNVHSTVSNNKKIDEYFNCRTGWYNQHNHLVRLYNYTKEAYVKYKYTYLKQVTVYGGKRPSPTCSCDTGQFPFNGDICVNTWYSKDDEGAECSQLSSSGRNNYVYRIFKRNTK